MSAERILVVEDEALLAELLSDQLGDAGFEPVGPVASVKDAFRYIEAAQIDGAILDIRLVNELSYQVAYALRDRGVPLCS